MHTLHYVTSHPIPSHPITTHHITSHHIISYHIMSCHIISYYIYIYPLALRANPATVPGVKLVRLVKLVKLVTLSISNQTKIDQHRPQNRPKILPKSTQNRFKIDQDHRPKMEFGWGLGAIWAPRWLREPT